MLTKYKEYVIIHAIKGGITVSEVFEQLELLSENEAKMFMQMLFIGYENRKKEGLIFEVSPRIPKLIILTYYNYIKKPQFSNIYENFKKKYINDNSSVKNFKERYIYNENKLEEVHTKEEIAGLRKVYDYIQSKEDLENVNLYTLSDIHEILYSLTPYPDFGGKYRRDIRFLPGSGVDLTPPEMIVHEMNLLRGEINDLVAMGNEIGKNNEPEKLIEYVDKCIELKCKFIKIHPFGDGNGRSVRAFTNLLFRLANIPPVYVENREKVKYGEAMQAALGDNDLTKIKGFYYYKICDSIMSLDSQLEKEYAEPDTKISDISIPKIKKYTFNITE